MGPGDAGELLSCQVWESGAEAQGLRAVLPERQGGTRLHECRGLRGLGIFCGSLPRGRSWLADGLRCPAWACWGKGVHGMSWGASGQPRERQSPSPLGPPPLS